MQKDIRSYFGFFYIFALSQPKAAYWNNFTGTTGVFTNITDFSLAIRRSYVRKTTSV